jgi:hypothetical protein
MKYSFPDLQDQIKQISQKITNESKKSYAEVLQETYARILYGHGAKTSLLIDLLGLQPKKARAIYKALFPDQANNTKRTIVSQAYLCRTTEQKLHVNVFIYSLNYITKHHQQEHAVVAFLMAYSLYLQAIAGNPVVTKPFDINQCHFIFKTQQTRFRLQPRLCKHCSNEFYHVADELQTICPVCLKADTVSCKGCGVEINTEDNPDKKRPSNYCSTCQRTNKNTSINSVRQMKKGIEDALDLPAE